MSLKDKIESAMKEAMKAKEKERLTALRGIKSMILIAETEKDKSTVLTEAQEIQLLQKAAKQRKESLTIYEAQGREDLASVERIELSVIQEFLPQMITGAELEKEVRALILEIGATGPKDMGKVMGAANKKFAGKVDNSEVSTLVKQILGQ